MKPSLRIDENLKCKFNQIVREGFIKKKNKIGGIFHRGGGQPIPPNLFFLNQKKSVSQTTPNGLKHENNQ